MGELLTRAEIEAAREKAMRTERISVPEWGGDVLLRVMTGEERDAYEADIVGNRVGKQQRTNLHNIRAKLVARCLIDKSGATLYDWHNPSDIGALGKMDSAGLDRVFKAAQRLNGLTEEDIGDLMGNSKAEANGVSGTP